MNSNQMRSNYDFTVRSVSDSASRIPIGSRIGFIDLGLFCFPFFIVDYFDLSIQRTVSLFLFLFFISLTRRQIRTACFILVFCLDLSTFYLILLLSFCFCFPFPNVQAIRLAEEAGDFPPLSFFLRYSFLPENFRNT
jgi:hypothetical protein